MEGEVTMGLKLSLLAFAVVLIGVLSYMVTQSDRLLDPEGNFVGVRAASEKVNN